MSKKKSDQESTRPQGKTRYEMNWRNKWLTSEAKTIDGMIKALQAAADGLRAMKEHGVVLDPESGIHDDYATLVTTDPAVARDFGFEPAPTDEEGG